MKALVLHGRDDLRYEECPTPVVGKGQVLVRVRATGICGSDLPRVLGDGAHFYPIILGHEFSGDVVEVGEGVSAVSIGQRVAGVPLIPCHQCVDCRMGHHAQCRNYSFVGSRMHGSFAEYVALPEQNVVPFRTEVSYEQGAFFEPSTVALHGLMCAQFTGGADVAILGGGTIGLFAAQWARLFGAKRVFVFDIDDSRLQLAKDFGADETINTQTDDVLPMVTDLTDGRGFGFVLETAGVEATMQLAFEIAGSKSSVCFIGTPVHDLVFTPKVFEKMNRKEFRLTGSWMSYSPPFPGQEWSLTADFFAQGRLRFDTSLIYRALPLSQGKEGFDLFKTRGLVKGKVLLTMD